MRLPLCWATATLPILLVPFVVGRVKHHANIAQWLNERKCQLGVFLSLRLRVRLNTMCDRIVNGLIVGSLPSSILTIQDCSPWQRSEEHTSELQSRPHLVCRLLLEKKK